MTTQTAWACRFLAMALPLASISLMRFSCRTRGVRLRSPHLPGAGASLQENLPQTAWACFFLAMALPLANISLMRFSWLILVAEGS